MTSYESHEDAATTPRPSQTSFPHPSSYSTDDQPEHKTPTRETFQPSTGHGQPPTSETSPNTTSSYATTARSKPRKGSIGQRTAQSVGSAKAKADADTREDSGNESVSSDGRPSKKKKGQKFYCTDYPPCDLSFTRSEHLARHIRKHTGERPFVCHCMRKFSRLDNLRQHAQTVHINEDIPHDSLAATGTRFQRQVRTDKVRTPGARARSSTLNSQTSNAKSHNRNVSTSSIGSMGSMSDYGAMSHEGQHSRTPSGHPPSLAMGPPPSTPSRGGLSVNTFGATAAPDQPYYPYYTQDAGYGSPHSVYSTDPHSPMAHTGLQSPFAMVSRGIAWVDQHPHMRRTSVPSGAVPFPHPASYGPNPSNMSPFSSSNASSYCSGGMMRSPTTTTFYDTHHDLATEGDPRRRTWHPGTYGGYEQRPATSGLSYQQTPDSPKSRHGAPAIASHPQQSNVRLPGINSFIDTGKATGQSPTELDSSAGHYGTSEQLAGGQLQRPHPAAAVQRRPLHQYTQSAPQSLETATREMQAATGFAPATPRGQKRHAWYDGPMYQPSQASDVQGQRTSPTNSSGSEAPHTPLGSSVPDYQPAIIHRDGLVEPLPQHVVEDHSKMPRVVDASRSLQQTTQTDDELEYSPSKRRRANTDRLDALVAVANQAATTR